MAGAHVRPSVDLADRRRLDFVAFGVTPFGCDVAFVSPLTREGRPQPSAASRDGAAIAVAERRILSDPDKRRLPRPR